MCAQPISASDGDAELAAALRAGWRRADLAWERLQEQGNVHLIAGETADATRCFRRAGWIAVFRFRRGDPRHATTLANLAYIDHLAGREARAKRRYAKAKRLWQGANEFIQAMAISRRARSSLFHLRMEARHWTTYQENTRKRLSVFAAETEGALNALSEKRAPDYRLFERWRAEKPPVFDGTRKLLAACLLIAAPIAPE
ncbi:MAG: tetratricopeptide repeat-containing protein [Paracoccaceae bacterium]|nr:tetratricopeptide repeat-containing protein [Paracoccaceae bacterium]